MVELKRICVFSGSSEGNDDVIIDAAKELGAAFAKREITLVYGGAKIGLMGHMAQAALDHHGKVVGIIPEFLKTKEVVHFGLTELITVKTMHERKLRMQKVSDGFIAMPGGMGTFEELFELLTWLQLGLHDKPIGLLNVNHFYDDLINQLETMVRKGLLKMENFELLLVDDDLDSLLKKMVDFPAPKVPKWLNPERS